MQVDVFSKGKEKTRNEDHYAYNETTFVVADGATDKSGMLYGGRTGGEILSRLITKVCLETRFTGQKLVEELTDQCINFYKKNNKRALTDGFYRFAATVVCAKIVKDKLIVTQVGDSAFRINGKQLYPNTWIAGELVSEFRSRYIQATGDIKGSRDFILPLLKEQYTLQNNSESYIGCGAINGVFVPKKFIKVYSFPLKNIGTLEIFSDGYYDIPKGVKVKDWESMYKKIEKEDPHKYKKYKATKSKDDRTIMVLKFK